MLLMIKLDLINFAKSVLKNAPITYNLKTHFQTDIFLKHILKQDTFHNFI
jgi:hypothetical protein